MNAARYRFFKLFAIFVFLSLWPIIVLHHFWSPAEFGTLPTDEKRPQEIPDGIPKKLWYKLGPHGLSDDTRKWTDTCINNNTNYQARFIEDGTDDDIVRKAFASRPDIVESYVGLSVPIFKADFLRYLLLFDQGGIYSDLDVSCEVPIDEWIPQEYKDQAGLVVGWEFDMGWENIPGFVHQFQSWLIMAKPRSPHIMQAIDDIMQTIHDKTAERNISVQDITLEIAGDVVDFTGPRRLTRSIYKSLETMLDRPVGENDVKELLKPKLVGDVLIMPGHSFAASSNKYTPEEEAQLGPVLVTHHYAGTWKNEHGGEQ